MREKDVSAFSQLGVYHVKELNQICREQDDKLERVVHRSRRRDSAADDRDETLGSVQRGDLRQRREQVHAHAEL